MSRVYDRLGGWLNRGQQKVGTVLVNEAGQALPKVVTGKDKVKTVALSLGGLGAIGGGVTGIENQFGILGNGVRIAFHVPAAAVSGFCEGVDWCGNVSSALGAGVESARADFESSSAEPTTAASVVTTAAVAPVVPVNGRTPFDVRYDTLTAYGTCETGTTTFVTDGSQADRVGKVASIFTAAAGVDTTIIPKPELGLPLIPTIADSIQAGRVDEFPVSPTNPTIVIANSCVIEGVRVG